jgi:hypothetical protein
MRRAKPVPFGADLVSRGFQSCGDERYKPLVIGPSTLENFRIGCRVRPFQGDEPWETQ